MSTKLFDLTGKTALITGSSRGLGRAIAEELGAAGARHILNGSNASQLSQTAAELWATGLHVTEGAFDIIDEAAIVAAFERFDAENLPVDILVNNAGIQLRKPMVELTTPEWQKVIDTNLISALVGREAAKRMIARGHGKIINIGSLTSELARARSRPTPLPRAASRC